MFLENVPKMPLYSVPLRYPLIMAKNIRNGNTTAELALLYPEAR